ncbi:MAG: VCBS repeat-containing protein, partial [Verrucomicrobia bacterium]|nr:VCBS repeat-containing protein [Verrucomicrobiota bacterium]
MNAGRNFIGQGDSSNAIVAYTKALSIAPNDPDLRLNLASAHLLAGEAEQAIREADVALQLEPNAAAAYFVSGSAYLRLSKPEAAVKAFENVKKIDPGEAATFFQLGMARMGLEQWTEAIAAFQEGIRMDPNHLHSLAHYQLAQSLLRAGRSDEAQKLLQLHAANSEGGGPAASAATFEKSKYIQPRVPFRLEQPRRDGIRIRFVDATSEILREGATRYAGPIGVVQAHPGAVNHLFVSEPGRGFRLLRNVSGKLEPDAQLLPLIPGAHYSRLLVGDLQNDRFEDVIVLGDKGSHLFQFGTNGLATDASSLGELGALRAVDGMLMDLDFTGKLDLVAVDASTAEVRVYRQYGPLHFTNITSASGIPASLRDAAHIQMEDWNRDGNMDVIVSRMTGPPMLLEKRRGGRLAPREITNGAPGVVFCAADFDNDLRPDFAVAGEEKITVCFNGGERREIPCPGARGIRQLVAVDYDNDGWLDLWAVGEQVRVWRNQGLGGFQEQTAQLGLDPWTVGAVSEVHFADFDGDCDSDVVLALANGGLRYLRNEGGNANSQIKLQLFGNRSNASGIGCKVEIATGGLRLLRTVHQLPVEVGVGNHQNVDSLLVHWFNWAQGAANVRVDCWQPFFAGELTIQEGSCPYLYVWDGGRFRFVTDILGAAPLGLPVSEVRYIEADPEELLWIGNDRTCRARDGKYQVQITEELREVLYLDEAKLVVVDHEPGVEVHSTSKLAPGKPFPGTELVALRNEHPLLRAETLDGRDVTEALRA